MDLTPNFLEDSEDIHRIAMHSLFERLNAICEGAIAVDRQAHVAWINEKYLRMIGFHCVEEVLGRDIEEIIPHSLMRQVVDSGEPILLDLMNFGDQTFVVTRMPLINGDNNVIGAIGFCLYDKLRYLKPLVSKFAQLQERLAQDTRRLAENRQPKYTLASFIGGSAACLEVKRQARRAAELNTTVLLVGETGTGKELLAQAIHVMLPRRSKPFIAVNTAAVPETLLEAEFFGAVAGAYTGADKRGRDGKFKLAHGGTLFLDEVGDMPLQVQVKLLRVLQEQEIEPLGSNKVIKVDVRVIAATSVDLKSLVDSGRFRSDLYYRLNVLSIVLPTLRERLSDLEALCEHLLDQMAERTGMPRREITPSALQRLAIYSWPGNVRELRNVLEQATLRSDNKRLTVEDFAAILPGSSLRGAGAPAGGPRPLAEVIANAERCAILAALEAAAGKKATAAKILGISRATLYEKIELLHL